MKFNVMEHKSVPEHHLVSEREEEGILKDLKIGKDQLPKIRRNDPCVQVLEKKHGPIEEGRVIKIVRVSETSGVSIAYRLVVGR
ncbi:MAG: DNA-directed RNA polymerase subunit H [Thermoplasmata archaeon]